MNWLPAAVCFYLAFGAILWLGMTDEEIDAWDKRAVDSFVRRMRPGDTLPGRPARLRLAFFLSMVAWPLLDLRGRHDLRR